MSYLQNNNKWIVLNDFCNYILQVEFKVFHVIFAKSDLSVQEKHN